VGRSNLKTVSSRRQTENSKNCHNQLVVAYSFQQKQKKGSKKMGLFKIIFAIFVLGGSSYALFSWKDIPPFTRVLVVTGLALGVLISIPPALIAIDAVISWGWHHLRVEHTPNKKPLFNETPRAPERHDVPDIFKKSVSPEMVPQPHDTPDVFKRKPVVQWGEYGTSTLPGFVPESGQPSIRMEFPEPKGWRAGEYKHNCAPGKTPVVTNDCGPNPDNPSWLDCRIECQ